jgi:hypothetical protein
MLLLDPIDPPARERHLDSVPLRRRARALRNSAFPGYTATTRAT